MASLSISAAVLAGGESRRMGQDKASVVLNGRTALEIVLDVLWRISADVKIIGDRQSYRQYATPVLADEYPGMGPLGGIATALAHARHESTFIVACDMPLVRPQVVQAMAALPRSYDVLVVKRRLEQGYRYEPLHAIYSGETLPVIQEQLNTGNLRVDGLFDILNVQELDEDWLRRVDPDLQSFVNMNTPEDVERVKGILERI